MSPSRLPVVWVVTLQSLGLALLLWAQAASHLSLWLTLLAAVALLWLPLLLVRSAPVDPAAALEGGQINQLSRPQAVQLELNGIRHQILRVK